MNSESAILSIANLLRQRFDAIVTASVRAPQQLAELLRDSCHFVVSQSPAVPTTDFAEIVCALHQAGIGAPQRKAVLSVLHEAKGQKGERYTLLSACAQLLGLDDTWKDSIPKDEQVLATCIPPALPKRIQEVECVVVQEIGKGRKPSGERWVQLMVAHENYGEFVLELRDPWVATALQVRLGVTLRLLHVTQSGPTTLLVQGVQSACVLEPDYLVDATDISHCMVAGGHDARLHLLKQCLPRTSSLAMIKGIAVGNMLESLIVEPTKSMETLVQRACDHVQHLVMLVSTAPDQELSRLRTALRKHYATIAAVVPEVVGQYAKAEQSLVSVRFGLSGRVDVLAITDKQCIITELKSGKPPTSRPYSGHIAQVLCYALMAKQLDIGKDRTQNLQLLYSAAATPKTINTVEFDSTMANYIIQVRNDIVALELRLCHRVFSDMLQAANLTQQDVPPFIAVQAQQFQELVYVLTDAERAPAIGLYIRVLLSFIARENWSQRLSPGRQDEQQGFSALWRRSLHEKQLDNQAVGWLRVHAQDKCLLEFTQRSSRTSIYRAGDIVVVHAHDEQGNSTIGSQPLHRCRIVAIEPNGIVVDKPITGGKSAYLAVEKDFVSSSFKALYTSVYLFACAPAMRQELFLGMQQPEMRERPEFTADYLSAEQQQIVHNMACAKHYYLLQGPPGTGKTSRIVRAFCERQFAMTDESTIVCAYTNRAVEEICTALNASGLPFVRIEPSHAGSEHSVYNLEVASNTTLGDELRKKRLIVGTISSLLTQEEVWRNVQPHTLLVDEASQITEAHLCGLVARVKKFVLIGDQHQLPPVVVQQPAGTRIPLPELQDLSCTSLHNSPFQRLHQQAQKHDWHEVVGMLTTQGRMHEDICRLPSTLFYDNRLETFAVQAQHNDAKTDTQTGSSLLQQRVVFVDVPITEEHRLETHIVARIVETAQRELQINSPGDIGVVAPFRKHLSGIRRALNVLEIPHENMSLDTIERYQGSEREIIVFSLGATMGNISKLASIDEESGVDRRLNVAITRARNHLIIVGNADLVQPMPAYAKMLTWIKQHGLFVAAAHVPELNKEFSGNRPFL